MHRHAVLGLIVALIGCGSGSRSADGGVDSSMCRDSCADCLSYGGVPCAAAPGATPYAQLAQCSACTTQCYELFTHNGPAGTECRQCLFHSCSSSYTSCGAN